MYERGERYSPRFAWEQGACPVAKESATQPCDPIPLNGGLQMEPTKITATNLRLKTRDLLERVKFSRERFVIETFGRPMAVIISLEDFQRMKDTLNSGELIASGPPMTAVGTQSPRRGHKARVKAKS